MTQFTAPVQAIALMLLSMAFFSAMNIVIRLLGQEMPSTQMVLLRNVLGLFIIVTWVAILSRGRPRFRTRRLSGHFWRASVGIAAMQMWFYSITLMKVTLATALSFTTPIFTTLIAILFLREKAGIRRWSAIAAGFLGMLVILRPGLGEIGGEIGPEAMFVIGSSMMMAVAGVLVKTLTATEPPETIVFYMALFMIPWALPPALLHWQSPTPYQLWLVFLVALLSTVGHLLLARAYVRAEMVVLMPLDFTRLVFTALFAYALFGETLDRPTIAGSLVIVASAAYIARHEAMRKKAIPPEY